LTNIISIENLSECITNNGGLFVITYNSIDCELICDLLITELSKLCGKELKISHDLNKLSHYNFSLVINDINNGSFLIFKNKDYDSPNSIDAVFQTNNISSSIYSRANMVLSIKNGAAFFLKNRFHENTFLDINPLLRNNKIDLIFMAID
jgi:hypothetical protein